MDFNLTVMSGNTFGSEQLGNIDQVASGLKQFHHCCEAKQLMDACRGLQHMFYTLSFPGTIDMVNILGYHKIQLMTICFTFEHEKTWTCNKSLSRQKREKEKKRERLVILGRLVGHWLDRILSSRHPFTKNQYPIICLERTMIQQSETLRCSLTMADSSFDETVDNKPVIIRMEARLDSS